MTLDSKPSTPDPPNPDQVIDSGDKIERTENPLENYYKSNIDHNHPNFYMIWEIVK